LANWRAGQELARIAIDDIAMSGDTACGYLVIIDESEEA